MLRRILKSLARLASRMRWNRKRGKTCLRTASASHVGGRDEQQDCVGVFVDPSGRDGLAVLADGLGGHHGGALASQTVVDTADAVWNEQQRLPADVPAWLDDLVHRAHEAVAEQGRRRDLDPRSTLVALVLQDGDAYWMHVGDSRLYAFRQRKLAARTRDHSLVEAMVQAGEIDPEEAASHPDQNVLLRSIGSRDDETVTTSHDAMAVRCGDGFILCSDGFWEVVSTQEMAALLAARNLQASLRAWVATAAERHGSGGDNLSAVAVRLERSRSGIFPASGHRHG